jgi:hypothetical protein
LSHDILKAYIGETQGSYHQTPKTLSIVDTDGFRFFIAELENLSSHLLISLMSGDTSLHTFVSRSRVISLAYDSFVVDSSNLPPALDIGSFLVNLQEDCSPQGDLGVALQATLDTYFKMFVSKGFGPGTPEGTGMHVTWPQQDAYDGARDNWNALLFDNSNYKAHITPNFRAFLHWFLTSPRSISADEVSMCTSGAASASGASSVADTGVLIISDVAAEDSATGHFLVEAVIAPTVNRIMTQYGIDLSSALFQTLEYHGLAPVLNEYLVLKNGDVNGVYDGATYSARWDQIVFFLNMTGSGSTVGAGPEPLYVLDQGNGAKKVPVLYFPESMRDVVSQLEFEEYLFFDFDYWAEQGARHSFLEFSVDEATGIIHNTLALYVNHDQTHEYAEHPRSAGGILIPLFEVDAFIQGRQLAVLPGGLNQIILHWSDVSVDCRHVLMSRRASQILEMVPSTDAVVVTMRAYNDQESAVRSYNVVARGERGPGHVNPMSIFNDEEPAMLRSSGGAKSLERTTQGLLGLLLVVAWML